MSVCTPVCVYAYTHAQKAKTSYMATGFKTNCWAVSKAGD